MRDGVAAGLSVGRMRGPAFARPYRGIRSACAPQDEAERVLAFLPRLPERAFFCGPTAAVLWHLPLPPRMQAGPVHVGVPAGERRLQAAGIAAHHLTLGSGDVVRHRGARTTSVERTWCDLAAAGLSLAELVAAGDRILWRRAPQSTHARLEAAVTVLHTRRGRRLLRAALPLLSDRADSAPESEVRVAMHLDPRIPAPQVNEDLYAGGRFLARPDFSWPAQRVALEYEGDHHRTDREQWQRDLERFSRMQEAGWLCLRASARDYRRPARLLSQLLRVLAAR